MIVDQAAINAGFDCRTIMLAQSNLREARLKLLARWQGGRSPLARQFARSSAVLTAYRNALLGIVTSHQGTALSHSLVCQSASRSYQR